MALQLSSRKDQLGGSGLITQNDIAHYVAEQLNATQGAAFSDTSKTSNNVMMLFTAIGKFVAFMFRKTHYETVIADIFGMGCFIRNCTIGKIGETHFYPALQLQNELRINKPYPSSLKEPMQR